MAYVRIKLEGVGDVQRKLKECRGEISGSLPELVYTSAVRTQINARSRIVNRSGELYREVKINYDGGGDGYAVAHVGVKADSDNARLAIKTNSVEYGHAAPGNSRGVKVVPAHPFMRPAIKYERNLFKLNIERKFRTILNKDR